MFSLIIFSVSIFVAPTNITPDKIVMLYDQPAKPDIATRAMSMDGQKRGECVEFIQRLLSSYYTHPEFRGVAGTIKPNSFEPEVGSVVLTNEGLLGHAAFIVGVSTSTITVVESNYSIKNTVEVGRKIPVNSTKITGYFSF